MSTTTATRPDTTDMKVVHKVYRREFRLLPRMVALVEPGDAERAALIGGHVAEMITALHHHHTGEDELLWPRLLEREELEAELIHRMEQQHEQVSALLDRAEALAGSWRDAADQATRDELVEVLTELAPALEAHLDEEERRVLPLVEEHITPAEYAQLGERGMASIDKSRLLVFLGHLLEDATPAERTAFLTHVPLPGRIAFRLIGQRQHRREVGALRAGLQIPTQRTP